MRCGVGVAMLPEWISAPLLRDGKLERVLPGWSTPHGIMHFVYPGRRGLLPGVRALVDVLAERLPTAARGKHQACQGVAPSP